jgi:hypothetical protein
MRDDVCVTAIDIAALLRQSLTWKLETENGFECCAALVRLAADVSG